MINVLFVAAEATPFVKKSGLAEIIGALPKAFRKQAIKPMVILPNYECGATEFGKEMVEVANIVVPVGWRQQCCVIKKLEHNGLLYYFLENEYYFKRTKVYGYEDDAERFTFFCRAVLEALPYLEVVPQVLHCHDWPTGMVSVLLEDQYRTQPLYQEIRTVFTIHTLAHQGIFPKDIVENLLGIGWECFNSEGIEFYNQVNFMKGGIAFSDYITTVSETYAEEIQTPYFGEGLDGFLLKRNNVLQGIVNGIDAECYKPSLDEHIFTKYNGRCLNKKQENKSKLQDFFGLPAQPESMIIGIVSNLVAIKGMDLLAHVLHEIVALDVQLIIVGTGEHQYEELFLEAQEQYPAKIAVRIVEDESLVRKIYAGADVLLMPARSALGATRQLQAMCYGTLPLVREIGSLKDTVKPYAEAGEEANGISFAQYNAHDMLDTIKQTNEIFKDKKLWLKLMRNAMKSNYDWKEVAKKYQLLYEGLLEHK